MQGLGLFTLEELHYSPKGILLTRGPGSYKIPAFGDIPTQLTVSLLRDAPNAKAIFASKVTLIHPQTSSLVPPQLFNVEFCQRFIFFLVITVFLCCCQPKVSGHCSCTNYSKICRFFLRWLLHSSLPSPLGRFYIVCNHRSQLGSHVMQTALSLMPIRYADLDLHLLVPCQQLAPTANPKTPQPVNLLVLSRLLTWCCRSDALASSSGAFRGSVSCRRTLGDWNCEEQTDLNPNLTVVLPSGGGRASSLPGSVRVLRHQRRHHCCPGGVGAPWTIQAGQPRLSREDPQRLQRPLHQTGTNCCHLLLLMLMLACVRRGPMV